MTGTSPSSFCEVGWYRLLDTSGLSMLQTRFGLLSLGEGLEDSFETEIEELVWQGGHRKVCVSGFGHSFVYSILTTTLREILVISIL